MESWEYFAIVFVCILMASIAIWPFIYSKRLDKKENLPNSKVELLIKYADRLARTNVVKKSRNGSALSFALVSIVIDMLGCVEKNVSESERSKCANEIIGFVRKHLNKNEYDVFEYATYKIGEVIRGELETRGDWIFLFKPDNLNREIFFNVFVFFGDLLFFDNLIFNYERAPIQMPNIETIEEDQREMFGSVTQIIADLANDLKGSDTKAPAGKKS